MPRVKLGGNWAITSLPPFKLPLSMRMAVVIMMPVSEAEVSAALVTTALVVIVEPSFAYSNSGWSGSVIVVSSKARRHFVVSKAAVDESTRLGLLLSHWSNGEIQSRT